MVTTPSHLTTPFQQELVGTDLEHPIHGTVTVTGVTTDRCGVVIYYETRLGFHGGRQAEDWGRVYEGESAASYEHPRRPPIVS